jgi:Domain of unknown function (DUF305)
MSGISIRRILKTNNVPATAIVLALPALLVGIVFAAQDKCRSRCLLLATSRASHLTGSTPPHAEVVMSSAFRLSIISHVAATAIGAAAATAYLTVYSGSPQSLADYISAICTKAFGSASTAEAPYLAENVSAMTKMMIDMGIRPSGDVDADFVAMMVPHHQGAIEMAQAELRYGRNKPLRRMAQEIIVTQLQEITAMRLSLGQALPPSVPSPDQIPPAAMNDSKSDNAALVKEP